MKVFVYRNLRKNCYSIKALEGPNKGRVVAHAETLTLTDCRLKVSKAGQARVRATKQKNVHAGIAGQWDGQTMVYGIPQGCDAVLYYNPYKVDTFVRQVTGEPVKQARTVYLGLTGLFAEVDA